jgi:hypothetical protein
MQELWRPVVGYEGLYEVSDHGRVRSLDGERWNGHRVHHFNGKVLTLLGATSRYMHVALSKDGRVCCKRVHSLVAEAFLPPCPGVRGRKGDQWHVDHIDDNPKNNRADNLQWLTFRENVFVKTNRQRDRLGRFI